MTVEDIDIKKDLSSSQSLIPTGYAWIQTSIILGGTDHGDLQKD